MNDTVRQAGTHKQHIDSTGVEKSTRQNSKVFRINGRRLKWTVGTKGAYKEEKGKRCKGALALDHSKKTRLKWERLTWE